MQILTSADYFTTKAGTVPRLTQSNFAAWSNAIQCVLIATHCWNIVSGVERPPLDEEEFQEFSNRAHKAANFIYSSVSPSFQSYVCGVTHAPEMWRKLCKEAQIESGPTATHDMFHRARQDTTGQQMGRGPPADDCSTNAWQKRYAGIANTENSTSLRPTANTIKGPTSNQPDGTAPSRVSAPRRHCATIRPEARTESTSATLSRVLDAGRSVHGGQPGCGRPWQNTNLPVQNQRLSQVQSQARGQVVCWYCSQEGHRQNNCVLKEIAWKLRQRKAFCKDPQEPIPTALHSGPTSGTQNHQAPLNCARDTGSDAIAKSLKPTIWFIHSGAPDHLCSDFRDFYHLEYFPQPELYIEDMRYIYATGRGTVYLYTHTGRYVALTSVLYVPELRANFLSVGQLRNNGYGVMFAQGSCSVVKGQEVVLKA